MTGGTLIYKCRICGDEVRTYHVPNAEMAIVMLTNQGKYEVPGSLIAYECSTHVCDAEMSVIGITEFAGVVMDVPVHE